MDTTIVSIHSDFKIVGHYFEEANYLTWAECWGGGCTWVVKFNSGGNKSVTTLKHRSCCEIHGILYVTDGTGHQIVR